MKKIYLFVFISALITSPVFADTILLKNGKRITVGQTWEEDEQIKCERFGSVIGYPKSMVEHVITDQSSSNTFSQGGNKIKSPDLALAYSDFIKNIFMLKKMSEANPPPTTTEIDIVSQKIKRAHLPFTNQFPEDRNLDAESQKEFARHEKLVHLYQESAENKRGAGRNDDAISDYIKGMYHGALMLKATLDTTIRQENLDIPIQQ